ncbi:MAG: Fe-S protein assembly co-chaperone HscB [Nitrospinota bacterium]
MEGAVGGEREPAPGAASPGGGPGEHLCWSCRARAGGNPFCTSCGKIQPPPAGADFFRLLGLPRKLQLDPAHLEERFFALSRQLHPDLYQGRSAEEQRFSLQSSAVLNEAYRTLKDPASRALYLVELEEGGALQVEAKPPASLFEEVLEAEEKLEELRASGAEETRGELRGTLARFEKTRRAHGERLRTLFSRWDSLGEPAGEEQGRKEVLRELKEVLEQRKYVAKVIGEIEEVLQE